MSFYPAKRLKSKTKGPNLKSERPNQPDIRGRIVFSRDGSGTRNPVEETQSDPGAL